MKKLVIFFEVIIVIILLFTAVSCEKNSEKHVFKAVYREKSYLSDFITNFNDPKESWIPLSFQYTTNNPWEYVFWYDTNGTVQENDYPELKEMLKAKSTYWDLHKYEVDPASLQVIGHKIRDSSSNILRYWILSKKWWRECTTLSSFYPYSLSKFNNDEKIEQKRLEILQETLNKHGNGNLENFDTCYVIYLGIEKDWM
ncbi:MAG: hypothetical protein ABH951_00235 [Patescibacteria group bacterium]